MRSKHMGKRFSGIEIQAFSRFGYDLSQANQMLISTLRVHLNHQQRRHVRNTLTFGVFRPSITALLQRLDSSHEVCIRHRSIVTLLWDADFDELLQQTRTLHILGLNGYIRTLRSPLRLHLITEPFGSGRNTHDGGRRQTAISSVDQ